MINVYLKKYVFYLIGIVLFSLMINLGTAWDDISLRMKKPLFQQVLIATIILLHFYLYFVQKLAYKLIDTCSWYAQLGQAKLPIFVMLCAGPVLLIHLLILNFLLAQRNHGSLFDWDYFQTDFWFFLIPLLCYVIFLYFKPQVLLFRVPKKKKILLHKREDRSETATSEIEITTIDQEDKNLKLWRETKVKKFIFDYYQGIFENLQWHLRDNIPLWKVVFFEKIGAVTFGYFANGEKWALLNFDDAILNNPWVLKINQNCFINMLYVREKPDCRNMLKVNQKIGEVCNKMNRVEIVALYEPVRAVLDAVIDPEKLDLLLQISRRMKDKNYTNFWKDTHLQLLDGSRLEDCVGRIDE